MDDRDLRFLCSTPKIKTSQQEVNELQASLSQLALENEELKFELEQLRQRCQQLDQTVQDQREIQTKMKKQLTTVTRTVYVIYERFKSLKSRYYEDQFAHGVVPGGGVAGGVRENAAAPSLSRRLNCDTDEPL